MEHSTLIQGKYTGTGYDDLDFYIDGAGKGTEIYVLVTSIESCSVQKLKEKTADLDKIRGICQLNGTIDLVMTGGEDYAIEVAKKIYMRTGSQIGIVKHEGQDTANLYLDLREALGIVRREGKMYHLYNPKKDSLEARIEADLSE